MENNLIWRMEEWIQINRNAKAIKAAKQTKQKSKSAGQKQQEKKRKQKSLGG